METNALVHALFAAELYFVSENAPALPDAQAKSGGAETHLSLSDYPAALVIVARYRLEVIRPLLEMEQRTRVAVLDRVQEIQVAQQECGEHTLQGSVSAAAIYRWIGDYVRSGNDLRALIPAVHERGGKHRSKLRSEAEALVEMVIQDKYKVHEKVTIDDVRYELAVRVAEENQVRPPTDQLRMPSRATLARRIEASNMARITKTACRSSVKRSNAMWADSLPKPTPGTCGN